MADTLPNQSVNSALQQSGDEPVVPAPQPVVSAIPEPQVVQQPVNPSIATPPRPNEWQVGVSASQLGLNRYGDTKNHTITSLIKGAIVLIILFVLIGVGLYVHSYFTGMSTKTISNGGYTYSFTFYNAASKVTLSDGSSAYKYQGKVASVKPFNAYPISNCSQIGTEWHLAFNVSLNANQLPVCTPNDQSFEMIFNAANHNQGFVIVCNSVQTAVNYPLLKSFFSSVTVSSNP